MCTEFTSRPTLPTSCRWLPALVHIAKTKGGTIFLPLLWEQFFEGPLFRNIQLETICFKVGWMVSYNEKYISYHQSDGFLLSKDWGLAIKRMVSYNQFFWFLTINAMDSYNQKDGLTMKNDRFLR
jgi:hypothetical protein